MHMVLQAVASVNICDSQARLLVRRKIEAGQSREAGNYVEKEQCARHPKNKALVGLKVFTTP